MGAPDPGAPAAAERVDRVVSVGIDPVMVRRDRDHVGSRGLASPPRAAQSSAASPAAKPLPPVLVDLLRQAHAAEIAATGPSRRVAWRTTRVLIGGVLAAGYSVQVVADCLGVGVDSIRTRATRGGVISAPVLIELLGLDEPTLRRWRADGRLPSGRPGADGTPEIAAVEVIRAAVRG